ncbi:MAG: RICIN domain-containing protein [Bacteroidaceae bacterium]|nr:RICIN domain-containing protein [Bacteroidaceae bacterium]
MKKRIFSWGLALLPSLVALGQTTASSSQVASNVAPIVPYNIADQGTEQPVRWGIDTAWRWSWWPLRATNHMRECVSLGRVTIDPRTSGSHSELTAEQRAGLDEQLSWLKKSGVTDLYLLAGNTSGTAWQSNYRTAFIRDIVLAVEYLQGKGYTVTVICPFNEPDFSANNAPSPNEMATVARLLRQAPTLAQTDIAGPSCLNPDYAYAWWETMKNDLQVGNTHQLAGSFDSFAGFYAAVKASGKKATGDEMHNINDALIGMNYGMSEGIWWSDYGGYTRAELGRASNDGVRIGYKENRQAWTSAAVFRRKSASLVEAFLGTSERQAGESAFTFLSQDRLAYYDGEGPYYDYTKATPGGTGYQAGQTNSEYVIEITYGEDVPVGVPKGNFKLQNKATGRLLTATGLSNSATVGQYPESKTRNQTWTIAPIDPRSSGDFSYVTIRNSKNNSFYVDGVKYAADNGAGVILYTGGGNECERWHLRYMGDGYYVITNHDSGLSLEGSSNNTSSTVSSVSQWERTGSDRQLWKLIPAEATVDSEAPTAPSGLKAASLTGSIRLTWTANTESDLLGYMVYRYNERAAIWETIGRQVRETTFMDNICAKGHAYRYRVRAVDQSWNLSSPSSETTGTTSDEHALLGQWSLSNNLLDGSGNLLHATSTGTGFAENDTHPGATFDGSNAYIALPYHLADMPQMTFSAWVKPTSSTAWQRIFDFGRDTENYLMLTPSNGSRMRLEICKDGTKQGLNATKRLTANSWTHVTVTLADGEARIYLDGELNARSSEVTLTPSDVAPTVCYLGRSMFDADPLFQGSIGDVCLYNYALDENEVQTLYYHDQLTAATELGKTPMNRDVRETLLTAIAVAENAIGAGDPTTIANSLKALQTAMTRARNSAALYAPLGRILDWSASLSVTHPQSDAEARENYEKQYTTIRTAYEEGEYEHSAISSTVTSVKTFTCQYQMTDARHTATESKPADITHLMQNPDFADNTIEGWTLTASGTGYKGRVAYACFEVWNHTFNLGQVLYGMPSGTYRLTAQAFYRNGARDNAASTDVHALLYIGNETAEIAPISRGANNSNGTGDWYTYATNKKVPNDMEAAAAAFNDLHRYRPTSSSNTLTADYDATASTRLSVGMKKTRAVADDWTIMNNFTLSYLGNAGGDGIEEVKDEGLKRKNEEGVFDLSGRRILPRNAKAPLLPKGIYIQNRRIMVVK